MSTHTDCDDPGAHLKEWAAGFNPERKPIDWGEVKREQEQDVEKVRELGMHYISRKYSPDVWQKLRYAYLDSNTEEARIEAGRTLRYSGFRIKFHEFIKLMRGK